MRINVCDLCGKPIDKRWYDSIGEYRTYGRYYKTKVIWETGVKETLEYCVDCMDAFKEYAYSSINNKKNRQ